MGQSVQGTKSHRNGLVGGRRRNEKRLGQDRRGDERTRSYSFSLISCSSPIVIFESGRDLVFPNWGQVWRRILENSYSFSLWTTLFKFLGGSPPLNA